MEVKISYERLEGQGISIVKTQMNPPGYLVYRNSRTIEEAIAIARTAIVAGVMVTDRVQLHDWAMKNLPVKSGLMATAIADRIRDGQAVACVSAGTETTKYSVG